MMILRRVKHGSLPCCEAILFLHVLHDLRLSPSFMVEQIQDFIFVRFPVRWLSNSKYHLARMKVDNGSWDC
jgi:hypothetical protein